MAFIDDLLANMVLLLVVGIATTVFGFDLWYRTRKGESIDETISSYLSAAFPVGLVILIFALWGEFTWPLPGSYNIVFYDGLTFLGISVLTWWAAHRYSGKFLYAGVVSAVLGILTVYYGVVSYELGLSQEPVVLLALYVMYGLTGLFSLPLGIAIDTYRGSNGKREGMTWILAAFAVLAVIAVLAALVNMALVAPTVSAHLMHPP
ncbi:MAG: DUF981 family protein [Conexivisphaera sp.]|jgi:putative membrane protein|nr:DUF981 family protein [Conexivisphaerales archaeon]